MDHTDNDYESTIVYCMDSHSFPLVDLWDTTSPTLAYIKTGQTEFIFRDKMVDISSNHNESDGYLFLFYAPHVRIVRWKF